MFNAFFSQFSILQNQNRVCHFSSTFFSAGFFSTAAIILSSLSVSKPATSMSSFSIMSNARWSFSKSRSAFALSRSPCQFCAFMIIMPAKNTGMPSARFKNRNG